MGLQKDCDALAMVCEILHMNVYTEEGVQSFHQLLKVACVPKKKKELKTNADGLRVNSLSIMSVEYRLSYTVNPTAFLLKRRHLHRNYCFSFPIIPYKCFRNFQSGIRLNIMI